MKNGRFVKRPYGCVMYGISVRFRVPIGRYEGSDRLFP